MPLAESPGRIFRLVVIILFKAISIAMIVVGTLIAFCIIADLTLKLGWGYPWWSLPFCALFIGLAVMLNRTLPGFIAGVDDAIVARDNRSGDG